MAGHPKLTVLFEKLRGKTFELDKDLLTVGRRDDADICLKDSSLSGHHADILRTEENGKYVYTIRDNDSTNGTRINNVPVKEQVLNNSDLILFGGVEVLFDSDEELESGTNFATTHTIDLSSIDSNVSTVQKMINLSPFAAGEQKKNAMIQKVIIGVVALTVLAVIGLVVWVVVSMFGMK